MSPEELRQEEPPRRLASPGHQVCLLEGAIFPRSPAGESLSRGILPLLDILGAGTQIEEAGFYRRGAEIVKETETRRSGKNILNVFKWLFSRNILNVSDEIQRQYLTGR